MPDGSLSLGYTDSGKLDPALIMGKGEEVAMPYMVRAMAGPLAEAGFDESSWDHDGKQGDLGWASNLAAMSLLEPFTIPRGGQFRLDPEACKRVEPQVRQMMANAADKAAEIVNAHKDAIAMVAHALLERTSLTGEEVAEIMASNPPDYEAA